MDNKFLLHRTISNHKFVTGARRAGGLDIETVHLCFIATVFSFSRALAFQANGNKIMMIRNLILVEKVCWGLDIKGNNKMGRQVSLVGVQLVIMSVLTLFLVLFSYRA